MRIIRTCKGCKTTWAIDYDQFDQRIDRSGPGGMYERVVRNYFRTNEDGVKLAALGYTTDGVCSKCNSNARVSGSIVKGHVWGVRNPECARYWKSYMWIDLDFAGALRYALLRAGGMNHRDACAQRSKDRKDAAKRN